jgi:hypothetical protein
MDRSGTDFQYRCRSRARRRKLEVLKNRVIYHLRHAWEGENTRKNFTAKAPA